MALVGVSAAVGTYDFRARAATGDENEQPRRCAIRLSSALLGKSPSPPLLMAPDPQAQVDAMLQSAEFITHFSAFINSTLNPEPGENQAEDATYYLAKHVLENGLVWKELFLGPYQVELDASDNAVVKNAPDGLGYFRSPAWLKRYAGNEAEGYKLVTAHRILNNTIGLKLTPMTNSPDVDISATGRQGSPCRGCHYDPWYALDKIAKVLTRRVGTGDSMTFAAPSPADLPQELLGGVSISSDKDLVTALVESEHFRFRQCRLVFKFLYGRYENKSEGEVFDKCMEAFTADGKIQSGIAVVAKDASFCE
jgi:hypothetical protein